MKTVCLKMAEGVLEKIDSNLELYNFSTRTEFIREAIRDKLQQLESQHFEAEMRKFFHQKRKQGISAESEDVNHDVFKELERRFGW